MKSKAFIPIVCLLFSFASSSCSADAVEKIANKSATDKQSVQAVNLPYSAGQHSWDVADGKLILISGRYTNQTSWDVKTYTFYLQTENEFYQVPVEDKSKHNPFEWVKIFAENSGEDLTVDYLIVPKQNEVYLLKAAQSLKNRTNENDINDIVVNLYKLEKTEEDIPYLFKQIKQEVLPKQKRTSVDLILRKYASRL